MAVCFSRMTREDVTHGFLIALLPRNLNGGASMVNLSSAVSSVYFLWTMDTKYLSLVRRYMRYSPRMMGCFKAAQAMYTCTIARQHKITHQTNLLLDSMRHSLSLGPPPTSFAKTKSPNLSRQLQPSCQLSKMTIMASKVSS